MNTVRQWIRVLFLCCFSGLFSLEIPAQEEPAGGPPVDTEITTNALAARQKRINRLMAELETTFANLSNKLSEENPDQADKLAEAYKKSRQFLFRKRMDEITVMLNTNRLENASREQTRLLADLQSLLQYLLTEDELARLRKMIKELEGHQKKIDELAEVEAGLKKESDLAANKEEAVARLDAWIEKTKQLIAAEQGVMNATAKAAESGIDAMDQAAAQQDQVRDATEALAAEMTASKASPPGTESLTASAAHQKQASESLRKARAGKAGDSERKALGDLKKALTDLEKERNRVEAMGPENNEVLAGQQNSTAQEAGQLAQQMADSPQAENEQVSQAQSNVGEARESMNSASGKLSRQSPGEASPKQQEAVDKLRNAEDKLQERIDELRDQAVDAQLDALDKLFRHMLDRQKQISAETRGLDKKRGANKNLLARADRVALAKLTSEESGLASIAAEAESLLTEDGTSIVFQSVVGGLNSQIRDAVDLMKSQRTGDLTQSAHAEIESTLKELLEALESARENNDPNDQPPNQNNNRQNNRKQRLVSKLAELKLLRLHQLRINRRTVSLGDAVEESGATQVVRAQFGRLAEQQDRLEEMAWEMAGGRTPEPGSAPPTANQPDTPNLRGEPAPAFTLARVQGDDFVLADQKGKVVVLDFWATWCGPCVAAIPQLLKVADEFGDDVRLVGVNQRESGEVAGAFLEKNKWALDSVLDVEGKVGALYGVRGIPQTVIIDAEGRVHDIHVGFGPNTADQLRKDIKAALGN